MSAFDSSRREFLKEVGVGAAILATPGISMEGGNAVSRPNVLFIVVDQLRMECLGAYGNPDIKTPNIDRLASDGVRFENSFCPYPVCTPSRYSFLSGQYVHDHRGWDNHCTLASGIETFPRILRRAGYETASVGKMHFTPTYLDVGFDRMTVSEQDGPGRWDDDYHRYLMKNDLVDRIDIVDQRREYREHAPQEYWDTCGALVSDLPEEHHSTTWIGDRAVEALESWKEPGNHLLMASFIKPHHPFDPPAPWHEMYDPAKLESLPGWTEKCFDYDLRYSRGYFPHDQWTIQTLRRVMAYYYATISQIDHHVGRMLEFLDRQGLYDNTLIVFTADHGDYMGHRHLLLKGGLMYDSLQKVPLIIKWPGERGLNSVSKSLVSNVDLAPSICRATGCEPAESMCGEDLRTGKTDRTLVFAESQKGNQLMARSLKRKLILSDAPGKELQLFFDLEKDPSELKNVYGSEQYADEISEMAKVLTRWGAEGNRETYLNQDEKQIDQPNVPPLDLSHRDEIIEYCKRKVAAS
jgi:arylsulfatase A-like enzyme